MGTPTGKDGKPLVPPGVFSIITDVIERAYMHDDPAPPGIDDEGENWIYVTSDMILISLRIPKSSLSTQLI